MRHSAKLLRYGIGNVNLVEAIDTHALMLYNSCRNSDGCAIRRYFLKHYGTCRYICIISYLKRTEHLCAGAYQHVISYCRMSFTGILAGTAERYSLIERYIIAYLRGFSYYNSRAVVNKKRLPILAAG